MKISDFQINTLELVPKTRRFEIIEDNNRSRIMYTRKGVGGSDSEQVVLPKTIQLTPEIVAALGIYYAEGNKSAKRWHSSFSNTEKSVVLEGIKLFNAFGIKSNQLRAHIKTYGYNVSDTRLVNHWSNITGIPKGNFIKTYRTISKPVYNINRRKPPSYGLVEIYYNGVVIRDLIDNLLNKIKAECLNSSEIRKIFLKGLFSGEGSIKLVNNKLREIRIASCNKQEQKFIRMLLLKEEIKPADAEYDFYIAISGLENFRTINDSGIINLHPEKKGLFDTGYRNLILSSGE